MSFVAMPTIHVPQHLFALEPREALDRLGVDGQLAIDLISDWFDSPYRSILRWAITAASGQDIDQELEKIKRRAHVRFQLEMDRWTNFYTYKIKYPDALEAIRLIRKVDNEKQAEIVAKHLTKKETTSRYVAVEYSHLMFKKINKEKDDLFEMKDAAKLGKRQIAIDVVVAMASLCQAQWGNAPLYRGICCAQGDEIYHISREWNRMIPIQLDHATSFTSDYEIAHNFAMNGRKGDKAVVLSFNVPKQSIVATHHVFHKLRMEKEVVVASDGSIDIISNDVTEAK